MVATTSNVDTSSSSHARGGGRGKGNKNKGRGRGSNSSTHAPTANNFNRNRGSGMSNSNLSSLNMPCTTYSTNNLHLAGSNTSSGVLGSAPTSDTCGLCWYPGHQAAYCPHRLNPNFVPNQDNVTRAFAALSVGGETNDSVWYPDSGAASHMTPHEGNFSNITTYKGLNRVVVGDGTALPIKHVGKINIETPSRPLALTSVCHVPKLQHNLISVHKLCQENNCIVSFDDSSVCVKDKTTGGSST